MTAITTFQTRVVIDHIRGTSAGLAAANPTVGYGVFVVETDADRGKFGDGLTAYNDLPYFAGEATWSSLSGKPFSSIGSGLSVVAGVLSATGLTSVSWDDVTGKPSFATVATTGLYSDLSGVPSTFTPAAHTHIIANTTGLQAALDAKAPLASPTFTGTVAGITKAMVGLGSVDNTTDASKPVSTNQAAADAVVQAHAIQRSNHTGTQGVGTITGLGTLATQSGTFSGTSSGTNTGDQTITLSGDATGSGTGSFAVTLSASGVAAGTYATVTVDSKGRVTAGAVTQAWSTITGTPTTLSGYGITDAAPTYARRFAWAAPYSYSGRAATGSATSASVWTIKRTQVSTAGAITATLTATNVAWDDFATASYS